MGKGRRSSLDKVLQVRRPSDESKESIGGGGVEGTIKALIKFEFICIKRKKKTIAWI